MKESVMVATLVAPFESAPIQGPGVVELLEVSRLPSSGVIMT